MPPRVVVVHDDPDFTDALVKKLAPDVVRFSDPKEALFALTSAKTISLLITRLQFSNCQPLGLSLARRARAIRPDVRVVFTGDVEHKDFARGLGEFLVEPVRAEHVAVLVAYVELSDKDYLAVD